VHDLFPLEDGEPVVRQKPPRGALRAHGRPEDDHILRERRVQNLRCKKECSSRCAHINILSECHMNILSESLPTWTFFPNTVLNHVHECFTTWFPWLSLLRPRVAVCTARLRPAVQRLANVTPNASQTAPPRGVKIRGWQRQEFSPARREQSAGAHAWQRVARALLPRGFTHRHGAHSPPRVVEHPLRLLCHPPRVLELHLVHHLPRIRQACTVSCVIRNANTRQGTRWDRACAVLRPVLRRTRGGGAAGWPSRARGDTVLGKKPDLVDDGRRVTTPLLDRALGHLLHDLLAEDVRRRVQRPGEQHRQHRDRDGPESRGHGEEVKNPE